MEGVLGQLVIVKKEMNTIGSLHYKINLRRQKESFIKLFYVETLKTDYYFEDLKCSMGKITFFFAALLKTVVTINLCYYFALRTI